MHLTVSTAFYFTVFKQHYIRLTNLQRQQPIFDRRGAAALPPPGWLVNCKHSCAGARPPPCSERLAPSALPASCRNQLPAHPLRSLVGTSGAAVVFTAAIYCLTQRLQITTWQEGLHMAAVLLVIDTALNARCTAAAPPRPPPCSWWPQPCCLASRDPPPPPPRCTAPQAPLLRGPAPASLSAARWLPRHRAVPELLPAGGVRPARGGAGGRLARRRAGAPRAVAGALLETHTMSHPHACFCNKWHAAGALNMHTAGWAVLQGCCRGAAPPDWRHHLDLAPSHHRACLRGRAAAALIMCPQAAGRARQQVGTRLPAHRGRCGGAARRAGGAAVALAAAPWGNQ